MKVENGKLKMEKPPLNLPLKGETSAPSNSPVKGEDRSTSASSRSPSLLRGGDRGGVSISHGKQKAEIRNVACGEVKSEELSLLEKVL